MKNIILSISKGRILFEVLFFLYYKNIFIINNYNNRKLYLKTNINFLFLIIIKNLDIKNYFNSNFIDISIFGKDILIEEKLNFFYKYYNLYINKFYLSLITNKNLKNLIIKKNFLIRVKTKYKNIAYNYLNYKNIKSDIVKINGGIELNLLIKNSDLILDIVSSGETVKINNLFILENIIDLNNVLVINLEILYKKIFIKNFLKKIFLLFYVF